MHIDKNQMMELKDDFQRMLTDFITKNEINNAAAFALISTYFVEQIAHSDISIEKIDEYQTRQKSSILYLRSIMQQEQENAN